jgi:hypothetical protein
MAQRRPTLIGLLMLFFGWVDARALPAQTDTSTTPVSACGSTQYRWMQRALDTWALISRSALELPPDSLPWIVLFDTRCAWHLAPRGAVGEEARDATGEAGLRFGSAPVVVQSLAHGDSIRLPSGRVIPPEPTAFTSLYRGDSASFFVMALPSLWRRSPKEAADPALEEFFLGVLAHEMAHTAQLAAISRQVRALGRRWTLPKNLNDDIVQQTFDTVPDFRQSIEQETDLLFRAAAAPDDLSRRRLARRALSLAKARRARYLTGKRAVYAPLEDLFLMMEGIGSWAAYSVALAHAPPGATPEDILGKARQGRYWSQKMGLAAFLVLDALLPEWRSRVFAAEPASVFELLDEAVRSR